MPKYNFIKKHQIYIIKKSQTPICRRTLPISIKSDGPDGKTTEIPSFSAIFGLLGPFSTLLGSFLPILGPFSSIFGSFSVIFAPFSPENDEKSAETGRIAAISRAKPSDFAFSAAFCRFSKKITSKKSMPRSEINTESAFEIPFFPLLVFFDIKWVKNDVFERKNQKSSKN
jgi:hypothetical protein